MPALASFDYAVLRVVPRVERGEFLNAGAIVFCRTRRYLEARVELDHHRLHGLAPWLDVDEVERYLNIVPRICRGEPDAGPIAALPFDGRWHWLVAPRSTVIQTSPVHTGLCADPGEALEHILVQMVRPPARRPDFSR